MLYVSNEGLPKDQADGATWETAFEDPSDADKTDIKISGLHIGGASHYKSYNITGYNYIQDGQDTGEYTPRQNGGEVINFTIKNMSLINIKNEGVPYKNGTFYNNNEANFPTGATIDTCNVINNTTIGSGVIYKKATVIGSGVNIDNTSLINTLFYNSTLTFTVDPSGIDYLYFLKTEIQFKNGNNADTPSVPRFLTKSEAVNAGINEYEFSLEGKVETEWGSTIASNCFQNSIVDDHENISYSDIFVDMYNFNLEIVPASAPEGAADNGGNIGAHPTSGGIYFNFPNDFDSYSNLDTDGNLVDPTQPAEAISVVKAVNGGSKAIIREINVSGFEDFSVGNLIDALSGLDGSAIVAGETLKAGIKYHNSADGEDITLSSGRTILAGENFITESDETSFSDTNGTANVYEIITERDGRNVKSIKMKVSDTYSTVSDFQTLPAFKYEYGTDLYANIDLLGNIIAGNGDEQYDPNFPSDVYRTYMQIIVEFSPNNIPQ